MTGRVVVFGAVGLLVVGFWFAFVRTSRELSLSRPIKHPKALSRVRYWHGDKSDPWKSD